MNYIIFAILSPSNIRFTTTILTGIESNINWLHRDFLQKFLHSSRRYQFYYVLVHYLLLRRICIHHLTNMDWKREKTWREWDTEKDIIQLYKCESLHSRFIRSLLILYFFDASMLKHETMSIWYLWTVCTMLSTYLWAHFTMRKPFYWEKDPNYLAFESREFGEGKSYPWVPQIPINIGKTFAAKSSQS